jgi:hypothetical protein
VIYWTYGKEKTDQAGTSVAEALRDNPQSCLSCAQDDGCDIRRDNQQEGMSGFLCGDVVSQSQHDKNVEEFGIWADTMSWVMPDEHYQTYIELKEKGWHKHAEVIFKKFAVSQI